MVLSQPIIFNWMVRNLQLPEEHGVHLHMLDARAPARPDPNVVEEHK